MDDEFKRTVAEMKPHAKLLPQKSDKRHKVTLWIKKLLAVKVEKSERNEYAKLLLHMLKSGKLGSPFLDHPPTGPLPILYSFKPIMNASELQPKSSQSVNTRVPNLTEPQSIYSSGSSNAIHSRTTQMHNDRDEVTRPRALRDDKAHTEHVTEKYVRGKDMSARRHRKSSHKPSSRSRSNSTRNSDPHTAMSTSKNESWPTSASQPLYVLQTNVPTGVGMGMNSIYTGNMREGRVEMQRPGPYPSDRGYWSQDKADHHEVGFQPPLTSTLAESNPHRSMYSEGHNTSPYSSIQPTELTSPPYQYLSAQYEPKKRSPVKLNKSDSLEDVLPSSPSFSISDDDDALEDDETGRLSDVTELLMGKSEPYKYRAKSSPTPQTGASFGISSSYTPHVSFTGPLPHVSPRKFDISRELLQTREIELKVKAVEARFEEEKLKVQRDHEELIKQIFDRKNNEIENLRTEGHIKQSQLESQLKRLEIKLSQMAKENKLLRNEGNQSVVDSREHRKRLEAQFDEKLHAVVSEFEHNKLELEQHHAKQNQILLQEMSVRISSLKEDHKTQRRNEVGVISKLKKRLHDLSKENESLTQTHLGLQQEKEEIERKCSLLEAELKTSQDTLVHVEDLLSSLREEKDQQLNDLRAKTEQSVKSMQQEYNMQESKMSETLAHLKQQFSDREREMEEIKIELSQEIAEQESKGQRALRQKDLEHEKKVIELKREIDEKEFQSKENMARLEEVVTNREEQLESLRVSLETQSKQAEDAIDEFKAEVEQQTSGMFDQMRGELSHLEQELATCRAQREKDLQEFSVLRQEDKDKGERERQETQLRHQQAISELKSVHRSEMEALRQDWETNKEEVIAKLSSNLSELEAEANAKATHSKKVISSLEDQVKDLIQQLQTQANQHSREVENKQRRGVEDKQAAIRIHEAAIGKLRTQLENQKAKLRDDHKREVASTSDKHNHILQQLEHEYTLRSNQSNETVTSLKAQVQFLEESLERQQCSHEDHVSEVMKRNEEERVSLKQHQESIRQSLQQEIEAANVAVSHHYERIKHLQADKDSELSQLKLHYEEKLKGMLPVSVKQEYEDTIKSLRTQISILGQRARVLQDELQQRYSSHSYHSHRTSLSPSNKRVTTNNL